MNVVLWILQLLYAGSAFMSGTGKVFCVEDAQWQQALGVIPWLPAVPRGLFIFIGACEVLGGLGLALPSLSRVKPRVAPLAGAGLTLIMIMATGFHLVRHEFGLMALTAVLGVVGAFVSYGRWRLRPIQEAPLTSRGIIRSAAAVVVALLIVVGMMAKG